jgi:hypothetical protein
LPIDLCLILYVSRVSPLKEKYLIICKDVCFIGRKSFSGNWVSDLRSLFLFLIKQSIRKTKKKLVLKDTAVFSRMHYQFYKWPAPEFCITLGSPTKADHKMGIYFQIDYLLVWWSYKTLVEKGAQEIGKEKQISKVDSQTRCHHGQLECPSLGNSKPVRTCLRQSIPVIFISQLS